MTGRARLKVHLYQPGTRFIERIPACQAWHAADPRLTRDPTVVTCVHCLQKLDRATLTDRQREILERFKK